MIRIETKGPLGAEFDVWRARAEKARAAMIRHYKETGKPPDPERYQEIWRDLKEIFLIRVFNGKCAFCEASFQLANTPPHVDHYRPKKEVTVDRKTIDHHGYFWLACEWYNLLLVCHHCNSGHRELGVKIEKHSGKANEFPIGGKRVCVPSKDPTLWTKDLEAEKPLLLNPYMDDPEDHIAFSDLGVPYAKKIGKPGRAKKTSKRGLATIEACHLHRESLCTARRIVADDLTRKRLHSLAEGSTTLHQQTDPFSAWLKHAIPMLLQKKLKEAGIQTGRISIK